MAPAFSTTAFLCWCSLPFLFVLLVVGIVWFEKAGRREYERIEAENKARGFEVKIITGQSSVTSEKSEKDSGDSSDLG